MELLFSGLPLPLCMVRINFFIIPYKTKLVKIGWKVFEKLLMHVEKYATWKGLDSFNDIFNYGSIRIAVYFVECQHCRFVQKMSFVQLHFLC